MLVLSRKPNEKIIISLEDYVNDIIRLKEKGLSKEEILKRVDSEIHVVCVRLTAFSVRLGFAADDQIRIVREELLERDSAIPS